MLSIQELAGIYAGKFEVREFQREPKGLYEPMNHIMAIPGKRIRPLLLLIACDAFGGSLEEALPASHAMELFHNFTLVHDDIMDQASLRRGIATIHEKFGLNAGVLSGDALFAYGYKYLCAIEQVRLPAALDIFTRSAIEILEGQQMDMDFESRQDVTMEEYIRMIGYKTSVLLACSLQIGAIIGEASAADQARLYDFGMKLGLSFQIKDDWLDSFGESAKVGKRIGGDIIQNKKTYLLITLLQEAAGDDAGLLRSLLAETNADKKVAGIMALYHKYGISQRTTERSDQLYREALLTLSSVTLSDERKANLSAMAEMVHKRDF